MQYSMDVMRHHVNDLRNRRIRKDSYTNELREGRPGARNGIKGRRLRKDSNTSELANFIKNAVDELIPNWEGCYTFKLDDKLAVCVGWSSGFGNKKRNDIIQSRGNHDWAIVAGIKDYRSDESMLTDYDWIDYPIVNGEAIDIEEPIAPNEDYSKLAREFIDEYNYLLRTEEYR